VQPSSAVIPGPRDSSPDRAQPAGIQLPVRLAIQAREKLSSAAAQLLLQLAQRKSRAVTPAHPT
ncbi:hypothetical protein TIFTF001_056219, partial [Ficus carica]